MDNNTAIGTVGGTVFALITINSDTIASTILVAILGAITSFFTSLFLKYLLREFKKLKQNGSNNITKN